MIYRDQVQAIKSKELDRKEFLAYAGAGLLSLAGVASVIKAFDRGATSSQGAAAQSGYGFGGGAYGGDRRLGKLRRGLE